jgi:hypothetical protein
MEYGDPAADGILVQPVFSITLEWLAIRESTACSDAPISVGVDGTRTIGRWAHAAHAPARRRPLRPPVEELMRDGV